MARMACRVPKPGPAAYHGGRHVLPTSPSISPPLSIPKPMSEHRIPTPALHQWVVDLWLAAGSDAREARLTADHLVGANLSGHDSHGVGMIPKYVMSWQGEQLQLNQR